MRAAITDHLLASLEGAVSPVWITVAALTDAPPSAEALRDGFAALVAATPRLQAAWRGGWAPHAWSADELRAAVTARARPSSADALIRALAARPARLDREPAFQLHLAPVEVHGRARWAVVAQLHHAMGDARALGRVLDRLWRATRGERLELDPSPLTLGSDAALWRWVARRWPAALGIVDPRRRLLARRALALPRDSDRVGAPLLHTVTLERLAEPSTRAHAQIFWAALLAQAARMTPRQRGVLRLRAPIDLSQELGWPPVLGNTCMAIPLEFDLAAVRDRADDAPALRALVAETLRAALTQGLPVVTTLECLLTGRVIPAEAVRRGAARGFTDDPRTNTLVTTHIGRIDHYFEAAPFPLCGLMTHTSTWGANAWTFQGRMGLNATAFDGLWPQDTLTAFAEGCADWIEDRGLGARAPHSPLWEG